MVADGDAASLEKARTNMSRFDKAYGFVGCAEAVDAVRHPAKPS